MMLLDTTVLIDVLRGDPAARDWLRSLNGVPACSEISRVEVLRGLRHRERQAAETLMRLLHWVSLDEEVARTAGELGRTWRRSHALSTPDLVIAATAQVLGAALATSNVRHFPMFGGLRSPYSA
jgi:predicted nucleic acid-binding protein